MRRFAHLLLPMISYPLLAVPAFPAILLATYFYLEA